ncbi:PCI domain-containing protein [Candidatus Hodarchaeum mangrovi]
MGTKKLLIISTGVEINPLLKNFLISGLEFSILLNTTADFTLSENGNTSKDKNKITEFWYHLELVELANALVPDDLTKSSLTKVFSQPIAQTKLPLTDTERFLVQWISERHKVNQDFTEFFQALTDYASKHITVYNLEFPVKEFIQIRTERELIPLRYFQITGHISRESETKTDLEELQRLLQETQESKGKKKTKPLIEVIGLDSNREIINDRIRKIIEESDAILILPGDPCSLAILLLHKSFTKVLKESKSPSTLLIPSKFSFREQFILQLLGVKPSMQGLAELGAGVVDHLILGPEDSSEVTALRSKGFNVIMEDLTKSEGIKVIEAVLKGMGISKSELSVEGEEPKKKDTNLEDLVTRLTYTPEEIVTESEQKPPNESEVTEEKLPSIKEILTPTEKPDPIKLEDTEKRNFDFPDPSLQLTQEMIESLMEELTSETPSPEQSSIVIDPDMLESSSSTAPEKEKQEVIADFESQEAFAEAIQKFLNTPQETETNILNGIIEAISKNSDMATHAAKKITAELDKHSAQLIPSFVEFIKVRPLVFLKALSDWFLVDLSSPDFVGYTQKVVIINQISKQDLQFIEQFIEQLVNFHIKKSLTPIEREHVRSLIGMIASRDVTLQRQAIRSYLSFYGDETLKSDEIWLGLLKFDAGLVALEVIEHKSKIGVKLVQDALTRNIGSFANILYDIYHAYQKGDLQRVLSVAGSLSDGLLRRKSRAELAEKIRKLGSVPIETLARSVELDPTELESLVLEMINENEINAKIDVIEGRLCIVQLNNNKGEKDEGEN